LELSDAKMGNPGEKGLVDLAGLKSRWGPNWKLENGKEEIVPHMRMAGEEEKEREANRS